MKLTVSMQLYALTGIISLSIWAASIRFIRRAPPSAGNRRFLIAAVSALGIGALIDGFEQIGFIDNANVFPELFILIGLSLLLLLCLKIRGLLKDANRGKKNKVEMDNNRIPKKVR